jgi:hypothetical protein
MKNGDEGIQGNIEPDGKISWLTPYRSTWNVDIAVGRRG